MAAVDTVELQVRLEGVEVHHTLEAVERRDMRKLN